MFTYKTKGVCAREITLELDGNLIKSVNFVGGCNGNLSGIACLVENMDAHDAITKLEGLTCGNKATSCPDQLTKALREAIS